MAETKLVVRRATEQDFGALSRIWIDSSGELTDRYYPDETRDLSPDPDDRFPGYRHLLATGSMFVAVDPDPVGFSAAVIRDGVWFLSQLWVAPDHQRRGVGAALLDEALAWGAGSRAFTVMASLHPGAQTLYLRRSMFPVWVGDAFVSVGPLPIPDLPDGTDAIDATDQSWIDDLDGRVRGIVRPEDHRHFQEMARGVVLRRGGRPVGYVYVWPDARVGPGAVEEASDFRRLLEAARHLAGDRLRIMVPSTNWTVLKEIVGLGLRPIGGTTFMSSRPVCDGRLYLPGGGFLA